MTFAGFQKESDIDNVVAYLKTLGPRRQEAVS